MIPNYISPPRKIQLQTSDDHRCLWLGAVIMTKFKKGFGINKQMESSSLGQQLITEEDLIK